jgi:hypothetical protein
MLPNIRHTKHGREGLELPWGRYQWRGLHDDDTLKIRSWIWLCAWCPLRKLADKTYQSRNISFLCRHEDFRERRDARVSINKRVFQPGKQGVLCVGWFHGGLGLKVPANNPTTMRKLTRNVPKIEQRITHLARDLRPIFWRQSLSLFPITEPFQPGNSVLSVLSTQGFHYQLALFLKAIVVVQSSILKLIQVVFP